MRVLQSPIQLTSMALWPLFLTVRIVIIAIVQSIFTNVRRFNFFELNCGFVHAIILTLCVAGCDTSVKAKNAQAAGAIAVLMITTNVLIDVGVLPVSDSTNVIIPVMNIEVNATSTQPFLDNVQDQTVWMNLYPRKHTISYVLFTLYYRNVYS